LILAHQTTPRLQRDRHGNSGMANRLDPVRPAIHAAGQQLSGVGPAPAARVFVGAPCVSGLSNTKNAADAQRGSP
jgi:hypothetical protein